MSINDFGNWLNNNQGILSVILFILTILLAWLTGFFKWIRNEISREKRASKIICAWSLFPDKEDSEFFEYKFAPRFQNKTDEIIKNFWINFATSGFELTLNQTPQISLFDGWNVRGDALHLTSKDTYKFAPQNFLEPFEVIIKLKKQLPEHGAWLYISYGVPNSKKIELDYSLTYKELKKFDYIIRSIYEYNGDIIRYDKNNILGDTVIFQIPKDILAYSHTNNLLELDKAKGKVELKEKGKFFVKKYSEEGSQNLLK